MRAAAVGGVALAATLAALVLCLVCAVRLHWADVVRTACRVCFMSFRSSLHLSFLSFFPFTSCSFFVAPIPFAPSKTERANNLHD